MDWGFTVALVVALPVILFPVVFVWYPGIDGAYVSIRDTRKRKAAREEGTIAAAEEQPVEKELVSARK